MLAWGFAHGFTSGRHSVPEAADRALVRYGVGSWAALELDDAADGAYNRSIFDEFVYHWNLRGMKAGAWYTEGGSIYQTPGTADFGIAEVEGPGDLTGVTNVIQGTGGGPLPNKPMAICTNFSTLTRENVRPLLDAGFACLTESYLNEGPNFTPDRMDQVGRYLGWPTTQPVFGVYSVGGVPPPSYAQWRDWPGVDYLGEYVM